MTVLSTAVIGAGLVACSGPPARPGPTAPSPVASSLLSLSCSDSAGQQGQGGETVIGGVEGLVLPGSGDPAGLYPIGSFEISSARAATVTVPIGTATC